VPAPGTARRASRSGSLLIAVAAVLALGPVPRAQTDVTALIDRAVVYVEQFNQRFGSMVTEERYEQSVHELSLPGARNARPQFERVSLVSDFLLVRIPGEGWTPFRDVFERNGVKVRDREERLAKLFLNGSSRSAMEQAQQIMREGSRYNIGSIERTINVPTLPLAFLTPLHRPRFLFTLGKHEDDGVEVVFREVQKPTYVRTTGDRDLPVSGRFWLDERTGAVHRTELDAQDTLVEAHIKVTYRLDEGLQLWVPVRMEERYRDRRSTGDVRGVATYSRFRKFQVSTSEEIAQ
jgi:hypothetical protein